VRNFASKLAKFQVVIRKWQATSGDTFLSHPVSVIVHSRYYSADRHEESPYPLKSESSTVWAKTMVFVHFFTKMGF